MSWLYPRSSTTAGSGSTTRTSAPGDSLSVPANPNPRVALQPNSLYVVTSQIAAGPGKFHWSLYFTNHAGSAMRIHWTTLSDGSGYAEGVVKSIITTPTTYSATGNVTFAYVKINGYVQVAESTLDEITRNVFSVRRGYPTYMENRKHGYSCKTWLLRVIVTLFQKGCITRPYGAPDLQDGLIPYITAVSTQLESQVAQGTFPASYVLEY
ncbi:hypothetical protein BDZ89DRAFT_55124 [Hymenopellis radicata]|nr:hypothetical protein BDZ89DRAFT_55124 [Hymenopellis radicata]